MTKKQLVSKRYASWVLYAKFQIEKNIVWWNILLWTCWRKHVFPKRSVRVSDTLDLRSHVIAISTAIVAKKLLVGRWQKNSLCQRDMPPGCCMQSFKWKKTLFGETFCFTEKRLLSILNFVPWVTHCFFTSCWLTHNQLSWNVLLFSCNPIGQLCLSGPNYNSCSVLLLHCS